MSPNENITCGLETCGKNVTKSGGSVCCVICMKWFHSKCVSVTDDELKYISKCKGKFTFICNFCASSPFSKVDSDVSELKGEIKTLSKNLGSKLDTVLSKIDNYDIAIHEIKDDISKCDQLINKVNDETCMKIKSLEQKNEVLQSRFNKQDIIINGLPREKINIRKAVLSICQILNGNVTESDLNVCCYINNRRSVLVKFNSLLKRNIIMQNYFKKKNLTESEVFNNNGKNRIYLNDHLTENGGKLSKLCRIMRRRNIIEKFRILNSDLPRVKIHLKDNSEKIFVYDECLQFFNQQSEKFPGEISSINEVNSLMESPISHEDAEES